MSANSRLTVCTHALAWMASHERLGGEWTTSEQLAASVKTNPVVIRRMMSDLVKAGLLRSGPGAGWRLTRTPERITLGEIASAIGPEPMFAMHRNEPSPICPIAQGIRPALAPIYARVDAAVQRELELTTLAEVLQSTLRR
jgi:DNA-binding IscR family transcriptional regulator